MSILGFRCPEGGKVSFSECLGKDCQGCLPRLFRLGIMLKTQYRSPAEISVTNLTSGCLRKIYWEKTQPYWIEPKKGYSAFRGSLIHEIINLVAEKEYSGEDELCQVINSFTGNLITETRFSREVDGIQVSGSIDLYNKVTKELVDFKSLNGAIYLLKEGQARPDHIAQTNIYRYLIHPLSVDRIRIIYVTMSEIYQTGETYAVEHKSKKGNYVEEYALEEVPVWSESQVIEYIRPKIKVLDSALKKGTVPEGVDAEHLWLCRFCQFIDQCDWKQEKVA